MSEGAPKFENAINEFPTSTEVSSAMELVLGGKEYSVLRQMSDENGPYLIELKLNEVDADGGTIEYHYRRKGQFNEHQSADSVIDALFCDADGIPVGGMTKAKYINGGWVAE